jgi:chromate transporter
MTVIQGRNPLRWALRKRGMRRDVKRYLELMGAFLKIGTLTFGGGYAMLPILEREIIKKKGWVTMDEVMNYYTIAQITPGVIGVNTATFVGRRVKGNAGGILASLAFILPGTLLMVIIAWSLRNFADYPVVRHAFAGIRVAVGALILDTASKLIKGVFKDIGAVVIMLAVFALAVIFNPSPVFLIVPAGIFGFFIYGPVCRPRKKLGKKTPDRGLAEAPEEPPEAKR